MLLLFVKEHIYRNLQVAQWPDAFQESKGRAAGILLVKYQIQWKDKTINGFFLLTSVFYVARATTPDRMFNAMKEYVAQM